MNLERFNINEHDVHMYLTQGILKVHIPGYNIMDDNPSKSELAFRYDQIRLIGYYNDLDNTGCKRSTTSIVVDMNYIGDSYITILLPRLKALMRESKLNKLLI